jgi:hypothetical protein
MFCAAAQQPTDGGSTCRQWVLLRLTAVQVLHGRPAGEYMLRNTLCPSSKQLTFDH